MVRHPSQGYVPYPGFLTETLRSQNRFHDPEGNSIFSWSDTTERYKQWTEAYSQPTSGSNTPINVPGSPPQSAKSNLSRHLSHIGISEESGIHQQTGNSSTGLKSYHPPVKVLSSSVKGTFTKNAVHSKIDEHGRLELLLPTMITPITEKRRTRFAVLEYDPLLDSSNIETKDWLRLAADIDLNYQSFDAFIILHGTDTMSYTSSALSMLLENLGKPVVVTGAQVPLSELRNDAIENVLGALILASSHPIPEVSLFFSSTLFRGNRVSKLSNSTLDAFDSPNFPHLATAGISIEINRPLILKPKEVQRFRAHDQMSQQVVLLRLFPGLQVDTIANFFREPIQGVVLHSFGAGNAPNKPELLEIFRKATFERNIVIVNISQCIRGEVSAIYQVGKQLQSAGVVAGGDMTPECALTKLSYLLAKTDLSRDQIRALMGKSLRGELTERRKDLISDDEAERSLTPGGVVKEEGAQVRRLLQYILAQQGRSTSSSIDEDIDDLAIEAERSLLPYLIQQACIRDDDQVLEEYLHRQSLLESIPSENAPKKHPRSNSSSQPTSNLNLIPQTFPLHIASALGHINQVRQLLQAGYLVHLRDYSGHTPLFLAAQNGHSSTVELLCTAGAHLAIHEKDLANSEMERIQRSNDQENRLSIWQKVTS